MFKYFVSYSHKGGFGNAVIGIPQKIEDTINDGCIKDIQRAIADDARGVEGVIILFYKEIPTEEE